MQNKLKNDFNILKSRVLFGVFFSILIITGSLYFFRDKIFDIAPKQIYEVAVIMRSQANPDPIEDARNSLKKGDVLIVQEEGHNWSKTEKISYLILKIDLSEEQKVKLTQPKIRVLEEDELSQVERSRLAEEEKRVAGEGREYVYEPIEEILIAREYFIDFEKDKGLQIVRANDLITSQPFKDKVFNWRIISRK